MNAVKLHGFIKCTFGIPDRVGQCTQLETHDMLTLTSIKVDSVSDEGLQD